MMPIRPDLDPQHWVGGPLGLMRNIWYGAGGEQKPPGGGAALHCQEDRLPRAHPAQRRSQRSLCQYIQRRALPPQQDGRQKC
jgi:hypothetical protein